MSSLKFYRMDLDFQFVKDNYAKADFKKFILQPFVPDADTQPDEFSLLIYALGDKGVILDKKDLTVNTSFVYKGKGRVEIGNIPFTRKEVKYFIDADAGSAVKIISLIFKPYDYVDYIAYKVKSYPDIMADLIEKDLKPSPPAPPEIELPIADK